MWKCGSRLDRDRGYQRTLNIIVNGQPHDVRPGCSVAELLAQMQIAVRHVAVEVNLDLVPRSRHSEHRLSEGDRVEVVTLVGGG